MEFELRSLMEMIKELSDINWFLRDEIEEIRIELGSPILILY